MMLCGKIFKLHIQVNQYNILHLLAKLAAAKASRWTGSKTEMVWCSTISNWGEELLKAFYNQQWAVHICTR